MMNSLPFDLAAGSGALVPLLLLALKTAAVTAIVCLVLVLGRRMAPVHRNLLCRFAVVIVLALPLLTFVTPGWSLHLPSEAVVLDLAASPVESPPTGTAQTSSSTIAGVHWTAWLVFFWAVGLGLVFSRTIAGWFAARTILRASRPVSSPMIEPELDRIRESLGIRRRIHVAVSDRVPVPFACGLFRSIIVVPRTFETAPISHQLQVLVHEAAHVRRNDILWSLLAEIVVALHWFNPFAWRIRRDLLLEAEKACDDQVLLAGHDGRGYAEQLIANIRLLHQKQGVTPLGAGMARKSFLEGRIMSILSNRARRSRAAGIVVAITVLCALLGVPPVAGLHLLTVDVATAGAERGAENADEIFPTEEDFVPVETYPEMTFEKAPVYPPKAVADSIEGTVWIKALIDKTGTVVRAKVAKTSEYPMLDSSAVAAAPECRFKPATAEGKPVAVWVTYKVVFKLDQKAE